MKFISLVVFEQLNMPNALGPLSRAAAKPAAARSSASSHEAGRSRPPSLTSGSVRGRRPSPIAPSLARVRGDELPDPVQPQLQLILRLRVRQPDEPLSR